MPPSLSAPSYPRLMAPVSVVHALRLLSQLRFPSPSKPVYFHGKIPVVLTLVRPPGSFPDVPPYVMVLFPEATFSVVASPLLVYVSDVLRVVPPVWVSAVTRASGSYL